MENSSKFHNISVLEEAIIATRSYSPVLLGTGLRQLRDLRKGLYAKETLKAKTDEQVKQELFSEYERFCGFNIDLLTTKKLSNAVFSETLKGFLTDYDMIKMVDNDKVAYGLTLDTLNYLKVALQNSNGKMSNYRLRGVNQMAKQFVDKINLSKNESVAGLGQE